MIITWDPLPSFGIGIGMNQISAKQGPDLRFIVEANTKAVEPKLSRSRIVKLMDQGPVTRPWVQYQVFSQVIVQGAILVMNEIWNDDKLKITIDVIY